MEGMHLLEVSFRANKAINQTLYINDTLNRLGMQNGNHAHTPGHASGLREASRRDHFAAPGLQHAWQEDPPCERV